MFSGMSNNSIDSKGRIVLPAKFREQLGETFYIARGFSNRCVQVMSVSEFEQYSQKIRQLPGDQSLVMQYTFIATATEVSANAQGRVMIPQELREFAKLEDSAKVIGMINRVEIWNKQAFEEYLESKTDVLEQAVHTLIL